MASGSSSSSSSSDKVLYLLRGVPGSGKSTYTKNILTSQGINTYDQVKQHVLSTDDFFTDDKGKYNFNPKKLGINHQQNQIKAERQMRLGVTPLFIDNTNIAAWEMKPYVELADRYGYQTVVVNPIDYSNEGNPILTQEGKINRKLIKERAEERRKDGSGKNIPDVAFDGSDGKPGMFDRLEKNMQMTPADVRSSVKPSFNRGNPSTRQQNRRDPRRASDDFKRKYLKYKNKYLSLKQKAISLNY